MKAAVSLLALVVLLVGCGEPREVDGGGLEVAARDGARKIPAAIDPQRGAALLLHYECARCHDGTGAPPPPLEKQCVGCHQVIEGGTFEAPRDVLAEWKGRLHSLPAAPRLSVAAALFTPEAIADYLRDPRDRRPSLEARMPRLAIDERDARDLAAHLASAPSPWPAEERAMEVTAEKVDEGRRLFQAKGCDSCHAESRGGSGLGVVLAPDLRDTPRRVRRERLAAFIADPGAAGGAMPRTPMRRDEAEALAAFVLEGEKAPAAAVVAFERLPLLERPVRFAEVEARVFRKICWHCHAEPAYARGDGGPGMTGGFGFPGRRLDLSSLRAMLGGYLDASGEPRSLFARTASGTPYLVAALLARHDEEAGDEGEVRGMPLGFPPLPAEDIQLVESWIAQGRRR